jgi:Rieske 2Fe-2S family protein
MRADEHGETQEAWQAPRSLVGADYHAAEVFERERERIFHADWYCVGRTEDGATGSFVVGDGVGESVIRVRDRDGVLRAFLNACRHRGARLCEGAGPVGRTIVCPYHAWSYRLDGALAGTPNVADDELIDRASLGLMGVALDVWDGFVWVTLAEDPSLLRDQLALWSSDDPFQWERYGVGELVVGAKTTYDVAANWKLIVENYNECLHCVNVHPELVQMVPLYKSGDVIEPAEPDWNGNRLAPGLHSFTPTGESGLPLLPGLDENDTTAFYGCTHLPNLIVNYHTDCVSTFLISPQAPDRTQVTCHYLFRPETVAAAGFDPSPVVDFRHLLAGQDWAVCERTQLGMTSRAFKDGGVLPYNDRYVHAFHERYRQLLAR